MHTNRVRVGAGETKQETMPRTWKEARNCPRQPTKLPPQTSGALPARLAFGGRNTEKTNTLAEQAPLRDTSKVESAEKKNPSCPREKTRMAASLASKG
jgi:hypothetical protein